jgi:hypothetical protein
MMRYRPPQLSTPRLANSRNGFMASRSAYRQQFAGRSPNWDRNGNRDWDHDGDHDRDRFRDRARSFQNWYSLGYPGWLDYGYPIDLDPWLFSDYDNSGYDQNNEASGDNNQVYGNQPDYPSETNGEPENGAYSEPGSGAYGGPSIENYGQPGQQPPPWPGPGASGTAPENQPSAPGPGTAFVHPFDGPLTVIFKGGRAPEKMQDYMVTPKVLTDLDTDHYEQIPLDQIDIPATARANRASGLEFQIPGASPD